MQTVGLFKIILNISQSQTQKARERADRLLAFTARGKESGKNSARDLECRVLERCTQYGGFTTPVTALYKTQVYGS